MGATEFFAGEFSQLTANVKELDYVISLETHSKFVIDIVSRFVSHFEESVGFSPLKHQMQLFDADASASSFIDSNWEKLGFSLKEKPAFNEFHSDNSDLAKAKLARVGGL